MHFERVIVAHLILFFLGFVTTTASNIKRGSNVIVPVNQNVNKYTNELLKRQQALGANFRIAFTEILQKANETLNALHRGAADILTGQVEEATPDEANEVMPLRKKYSQMIQDTANLWMIDDKIFVGTSGGPTIRGVIDKLKEHKSASENFGKVVKEKMPSSMRKKLGDLDQAAHFALQNAIGLWKSREENCEFGQTKSSLCDYGI